MFFIRRRGLIWKPRGEVAAYDLTETDFTQDSTWQTMVVPAVVPLNAKRVKFLVSQKCNTLGAYTQWRENGVTSDFNRYTRQMRVPAISEVFILDLALNNANQIDYKVQALVWIDLNFVVTAWAL